MKQKDDIDRRLVRVPMYEEVVNDIFTGGLEISAALPDDARYVWTYDDHETRTFYFVFKSEEFDIVDEGDEIPEMDVNISQHPERRSNDSDGLSYSYQ